MSAYVTFFLSGVILFIIFFQNDLHKDLFRTRLDIEKDWDTFEEIAQGKYVNRIGTRCLIILGIRSIILGSILLVLFIEQETLVDVFHSIDIGIGVLSVVLGLFARKGFIRSIAYVGDFYINEVDVAIYAIKLQEHEEQEIKIPKRVYKPIYCKYCGKKLADGAIYCKNCGATIGNNY